MTLELEARSVNTADELRAIRADEAFHEGALSLLTYPTADPIGYLSHENDKAMFGKLVRSGEGAFIVKGPAGDFEVGQPVVDPGDTQ